MTRGVSSRFFDWQGRAARAGEVPAPIGSRASEDLELAARCVSGDAAAQRDLFERERRYVHATLFRIVGSNLDMDDLVQDAFFEVYRSLHGFRGEASLRTWIDRCTVRVAYAYFARRPRGPQLAVLPAREPESPSAEAQILAREATRRLYAELARLDPKQRVAFTLHVVDGRPLSEVASLTDSSIVATKSRIWRARRALDARARKDSVLRDFLALQGAPEKDGGT
jgi:RNA polymerase sigma-70 factor (ECF subfamily)